ncbi:iron reductase domain protein [Piedraia hortae CBS 480.64]|uniref:Iron reductase domain protein n=1 Tax=Piedraia hortae CBS 480.64 TaxID=1314780 RepID=A0A6A7BW68_9PEZI|nr:iron reductase domain protein [Piedraia hortae CBS 480.64]
MALFLVLSLVVALASVASSSSAVFVFDDLPAIQPFVFALTVDEAKKDLYIHMAGPASNSWMGVGIGEKMAHSFFFVAYTGSGGTSMILSPRVATGQSEPFHYKQVSCELVSANDLQGNNSVSLGLGADGIMSVDAVCHDATSWTVGGKRQTLDLTNSAQPFIFALGPGYSMHGGNFIQSDSLSANLRRHYIHGHFTMDMKQATVSEDAQVPRPNGPDNTSYITSGATSTGSKLQIDPAPIIHGFVMCVSFVVIFPLGAFALRFLNSVRSHMAVQVLGLVMVCMALAGGSVVSVQYNKSKHFRSPHQVIGILVLIALFAQLGLGIIHHRIYKKQHRGTPMGRIHHFLGPSVIAIGIINVPVGFMFAGNARLSLPFFFFFLVVVLCFALLRFFVGRFRKPKPPVGMPPTAYVYSQTADAPPAYSPSRNRAANDVQLMPVASPESQSRRMA